MNIPKDPIILYSFINMKLRDEYSNLDDLCKSIGLDKPELIEKLAISGYRYSPEHNQFV